MDELLQAQIEDLDLACKRIEKWMLDNPNHVREEEAYQKIVGHCEQIKVLSAQLWEYNRQPYKEPAQGKLC